MCMDQSGHPYGDPYGQWDRAVGLEEILLNPAKDGLDSLDPTESGKLKAETVAVQHYNTRAAIDRLTTVSMTTAIANTLYAPASSSTFIASNIYGEMSRILFSFTRSRAPGRSWTQ